MIDPRLGIKSDSRLRHREPPSDHRLLLGISEPVAFQPIIRQTLNASLEAKGQTFHVGIGDQQSVSGRRILRDPYDIGLLKTELLLPLVRPSLRVAGQKPHRGFFVGHLVSSDQPLRIRIDRAPELATRMEDMMRDRQEILEQDRGEFQFAMEQIPLPTGS